MKKLYTTMVIALISINSFAQTPNWAWAKSMGASGYEYGNSVATDATGNIYVTGGFTSPTIVFGTTTLTNSGGVGSNDMYLVKYDATGAVLWAISAGGSYNDWGYSVTTDATGDIYVSGYFSSPTLVFGTTTLIHTALADMFLVKYDATGTVLWAKSAGGSNDDNGISVATNATGDVYVTGFFTSPTLVFGTTTLTNAGNRDMFLVKYDATGTVLWAKSTGGSGDDFVWSVATDAGGDVYVVGEFASPTIVFGTTTLTNTATSDMFLVKYDATGLVLWAKSAGGSNYDEGISVATDAAGDIYVTGDFASPTLVFDTTTLTNTGGFDMFLVKYDATGTVLWAKNTGGSGNDYGVSVATEAAGDVYVTGSFASPTLVFGTTTLTIAGSDDIFLVKYDATGQVLWAKSAGGSGSDQGISVATDAAGDLYVTGAFYSPTIVFGGTTLTNSGSDDMYLAKINATTGIQEQQLVSGFSISPNPFTSHTTITFSEAQKNTTIRITDMLGQEIKTINFTGKQLTIDKGEMKAGIYFVQTTDEKKNVTNKKIIIQ